MFTKSEITAHSIEARRELRAKAERRWRRARRLPKVCGVLVLASIAVLIVMPFFRLGPLAPVVAGCVALLSTFAVIATSISHRAAFMTVQKSRGVNDGVAERAYTAERPFA